MLQWMEAVICIFSTKKEAQSTRKGRKGCKVHFLVKFFFTQICRLCWILIKIKFRINQNKNKESRNKPCLAGEFKPLKNINIAQASTYLRIAYSDGNFSWGWGQKYWGGPGPPWPPPRDPPRLKLKSWGIDKERYSPEKISNFLFKIARKLQKCSNCSTLSNFETALEVIQFTDFKNSKKTIKSYIF